MDDQDDNITLAALLGGIWPQSLFMAKLARQTPSTLREFMDREDDFINADDTLHALLEPQKQETKPENRNQSNSKDKDENKRPRPQG